MRRSAFRKPSWHPGSPTSSLTRSPLGSGPMPLSSLSRGKPIERTRMKRRPTREKVGRTDKKYRRYLSRLPCCVCGLEPPTPVHHERKKTTGLALKEPDSRAMPLCDARTGVNGCHNDFHEGKGFFRRMTGEQKKAWMEQTIDLLQEGYARAFGEDAHLREEIARAG